MLLNIQSQADQLVSILINFHCPNRFGREDFVLIIVFSFNAVRSLFSLW